MAEITTREFMDAADAIHKLAKQYEQMSAVAKVIQEIGSLEQARAERPKALAASDKKLAETLLQIEEQKEKLDDLQGEADLIKASSEAYVQEVKDRAALDAEATVNKANEVAATLIAQAHVEELRIVSAAKAKADVAAQEAQKLRAEADDLGAKLTEQKQELSKLESAIAKARGDIAALLRA